MDWKLLKLMALAIRRKRRRVAVRKVNGARIAVVVLMSRNVGLYRVPDCCEKVGSQVPNKLVGCGTCWLRRTPKMLREWRSNVQPG